MNAICAWCNAPRTLGPVCQKCGADYEKAARIKAGVKPEAKPRTSKAAEREASRNQRLLAAWDPVKDPVYEHQLCLWVLPCMLGLTFAMEIAGIGDSMLRIVFGMPVHEFGHAVVGWLCGFNTIPTLWKTLIPENQGFIAPALLFAGTCYAINYARLRANGYLLLAGVLLFVVQFSGTFILDKQTSRMLITWGGNGMGMILAIALMAGFSFNKHTSWYSGYLRWGFAFIGAAAFADIAWPWWASLSDISAVPYGTTGGNPTDTYKLIHTHGWQMEEVVNRYVTFSVICMCVLTFFYLKGLRQATKVIELRNESRLEPDMD